LAGISLFGPAIRVSWAITLAEFPPPRKTSRQSREGLVVAIYQHIRHPRIASRLADSPVKVADLLPRGSAINRFNTSVALLVTKIRSGAAAIVSWVAQTFLQLVLLSVIMVGQNVQAAAADKRAEATFHDASATLHEVAHVQGHLAAQDVLLTRIAERIGLDPVPIIDAPAGEEPTAQDPGK
jgi:hypothetical protein